MMGPDRTYLCFCFLSLYCLISLCTGQNFWKISQVEEEKPEDRRIKIVWCTVSRQEQKKCRNFKWANERDQINVGYDYFKIECIQAYNKDECMKLLDEEKAVLTSLDAGEVFIGGRYNSLVPIAQEVPVGASRHYYAVAVVKKGELQDVLSLHDLRGKRACFAGVQTFAGWVLPIYTLMQAGGLQILDCNNHVKSAANYFGPSCAVNSLTDKFNPIGDNSDKLCQLCIGRIPGGRCTSSDPYSGYDGAFRCLLETGDIAFLKHTTIPELLSGNEFTGISQNSYELLCLDGSRRPINDYLGCNWGLVPGDAIVTTSASSFETRKKYQTFLKKAAELYGQRSHGPAPAPQDGRDRGRPQFDQFGNIVNQNRYKRQNYGNQDGTQYDQRNDTRFDQRYNQDGSQYDNRPYGQGNEQYGRGGNYGAGVNQDGRYNNPQYGQDANQGSGNPPDNNQFNQNNQFGPSTGQPDDRNRPTGNDPFLHDPFTINRDQFGHNIDPYEDGSFQNKNKNTVYTYNNSLPPYDDDDNQDNKNEVPYEDFRLFLSTPRYGIHGNLLFQDGTVDFAPLNDNQQTYSSFLGNSLDVIMGVRRCTVNRMTLCVTSDVERDKCVKMRTALKAQLLKPEMDCYKGHSQIHCMQAIRSGTADVAVLDASDVYTAGLNFDLVPFISEVYNLNEPEYYVVAVAKESDPSTELTYLRGKYTCHGGINTAAGWVYPLAFLISNGWIRPYGCNSIRAAAEYFSKSCVPGALSTEYNTGVPYDNMCDLCHGTSYRYCRRDASEDYYGHTGAFRCLVEGGGQVAFVKHTTVTENTGGKREEWWARDNLNDDFELLCPDGTRAEIHEYEKCNLGRVKANAVVTRGGYGYNETQINAYINLFLYAQTFYGRKTTDEFSFSMFSSMPPYTDLIFQDATTQLKVIEPSKRYYSSYLGSDYMRARRVVDCHAGSESISASIVVLILSFISTAMLVF